MACRKEMRAIKVIVGSGKAVEWWLVNYMPGRFERARASLRSSIPRLGLLPGIEAGVDCDRSIEGCRLEAVCRNPLANGRCT